MKKTFLSILAVGLVVAACSSATDTDPAVDDANVVKIEVGGANANNFSPAEVTIKVGQTVRWTFGSGTHNVVSGAEGGKPVGKGTGGDGAGTGTLDLLFETPAVMFFELMLQVAEACQRVLPSALGDFDRRVVIRRHELTKRLQSAGHFVEDGTSSSVAITGAAVCVADNVLFESRHTQ